MNEIAHAHVRVGDIVAGKYRVERTLGEGGMGIVVAATHEQLDQRVALKFLQPTLASREDIVQRFMREARAAVKIQSEHVARVFDVGTHAGAPYMVMEYLEGSDLAQVLESGSVVPVKDAVGYVIEACAAVAEAHALGIVHRDLKPANLFLANRANGKPIVKVLDFGISKSKPTDKDAGVTNASAIMGSPSYMSPEQMVASASVDARSDVWSLGVVIYELVSRKVPFTANSMPELVGVILQGKFEPIADIPIELHAVITRCLQKEREQRFQNVAELARALLPFGPARAEALVERIESTLGLSPASQRAPAVLPRSGAAEPTFAPTTTMAPAKRSPLVWIAPLTGIAALIAITVVATRSTRPLVTPSTSTEAPTFAASTAPLITAEPHALREPQQAASDLSSAVVAPDTAAPPPLVHAKTYASAHAPSASASASASPAASAGCRTVSYFDTRGNKHFKLECPP